ncbi:peptidoglycan DD-metalloendopeptidase family protein [Enterococcus rivorum]|uniref:Mannosyl-glycoprotein endo-beta-N-acetylglucosamidase-like domain-containing protein n=1 Tax=Enterococcus rivorum TaxID=762845 RepID=A0A1E5L090_9ENTE|nr:peptidoglycan DD-metalloendopeptidase family protein [Enterococcus rivorum]MBP2098790.1 flagellum-specific peptidoglycan hydrolase FlgJ [Enterococcus rivorum]OEH83527.1 hypothetical protein BCR26_08585 [Enterococcus rivorum]
MRKIVTLLTISTLCLSMSPISGFAMESEAETTTETSLEATEISSTETIPESTETSNTDTKPEPVVPTETTTESVPETTTESSQIEQPLNQIPQDVPTKYPSEEQVVPDVQRLDGEAMPLRIERNQTTEEFVKKVGNEARKVAEENDLFASVMIAQAILESGSGSSRLSQAPNHNLFGMKGEFEGQSVSFTTQEDDGTGNLYTIQSSFRKYPSFTESFQDYSDLLKQGVSWNEMIYQGTWKSIAGTYQNATKSLTGVYATDIHYDEKLNQLIETYGLARYDFPEAEDGQFTKPLAEEAPVTSTFGGEDNHRGVDFATNEGTPIHAMAAGTVIFAHYHDSWGNYVAIQHSNGLVSLYAHQSAFAVSVGDTVMQGQVIGFVGSTGNSTGSHLHLEICQDSTLTPEKLVDPMSVISNG